MSTMFCTACGHEGHTATHTKGHFAIELVLWCCFVVPGLIYSIWRLSTRTPVCSSCGSAALVPGTSPVATRMRKDLDLGPALAPGAVGPSGELL